MISNAPSNIAILGKLTQLSNGLDRESINEILSLDPRKDDKLGIKGIDINWLDKVLYSAQPVSYPNVIY